MPEITVVIPTISGREESLARAVSSYEDMGVDCEIIVVKDEPTWPTACNVGYAKSTGDVIHFSADDLEAIPGWWERPYEWLQKYNELPAPRVYNFSADGDFDNASDGEDEQLTHFTRIPIMTRAQYETIGPWPEINYYADIWLSEKARTLGIRTRMIYGYDFVHHWSQIGRMETKERFDEAGWALNRLREAMV